LLKRLAVVELDFDTHTPIPNIVKREVRRDKQEKHLKEWTKLLIPVLNDSSSKDRKFLRWKLSEIQRISIWRVMGAVESGKLEVLPETPLPS
jgi:hypothetical protein